MGPLLIVWKNSIVESTCEPFLARRPSLRRNTRVHGAELELRYTLLPTSGLVSVTSLLSAVVPPSQVLSTSGLPAASAC